MLVDSQRRSVGSSRILVCELVSFRKEEVVDVRLEILWFSPLTLAVPSSAFRSKCFYLSSRPTCLLHTGRHEASPRMGVK